MEKQELLTYHVQDSGSVDCEADVKQDPESCQLFKERVQNPWQWAWVKFSLPLATFLLGFAIAMIGTKTPNPVEAGYRPWLLSYSPAIPHISFKPESDQKPKSPESDPRLLYDGPVSKKQEAAWYHLLYPVEMSLTREEMVLAGEDPNAKIQLADRTNYPATLDVFHQLHCLRKVRRFVYREFWYANSTDEQVRQEQMHADHCLYVLHLSTMCHADLGINTFEVNKAFEQPTTATKAERMCIDWQKFHDWATSVSIGFEPEIYIPPHLWDD